MLQVQVSNPLFYFQSIKILHGPSDALDLGIILIVGLHILALHSYEAILSNNVIVRQFLLKSRLKYNYNRGRELFTILE